MTGATSSKLEEELKERLHTRRLDKLAASFSGACISNGHCYSLDDGSKVFVKTNGSQYARKMFDGELESLRQINATKTIRAPKGISVIHNFDRKENSAIVMEYLDIVSLSHGEIARSLGQDLANLHDYNNKVTRFQEKASKWVGNTIPSTRHIIDVKLEANQSAIKSDQERDDNYSRRLSDDHKEDADEEEDIQFSKHSLRVKTMRSIGQQQENTEANEQQDNDACSQRFVPEPSTESITQFGFEVATSCGSIPQINEWTPNWVSFFTRHRLDHTIRMILSDHSDRELNEQWSCLQNKVDKFFTDFQHKGSDDKEIVPALLHGDLWSGNLAELTDSSTGAVYDPASFYGHSEYDFGIIRMFGGIAKQFEMGYFEVMPKGKLFDKRNKLYQLFHHLNHWNHFGTGYRSSSLAIMNSLNTIV